MSLEAVSDRRLLSPSPTAGCARRLKFGQFRQLLEQNRLVGLPQMLKSRSIRYRPPTEFAVCLVAYSFVCLFLFQFCTQSGWQLRMVGCRRQLKILVTSPILRSMQKLRPIYWVVALLLSPVSHRKSFAPPELDGTGCCQFPKSQNVQTSAAVRDRL